MLELLGAKTDSSCAGHPQGFYITFAAPYKLALKISSIGYFPVEILEKGAWRLSIPVHMTKSYSDRNRTLAWASEAWEEEFGKLKRGGISWAGNYKL